MNKLYILFFIWLFINLFLSSETGNLLLLRIWRYYGTSGLLIFFTKLILSFSLLEIFVESFNGPLVLFDYKFVNVFQEGVQRRGLVKYA